MSTYVSNPFNFYQSSSLLISKDTVDGVTNLLKYTIHYSTGKINLEIAGFPNRWNISAHITTSYNRSVDQHHLSFFARDIKRVNEGVDTLMIERYLTKVFTFMRDELTEEIITINPVNTTEEYSRIQKNFSTIIPCATKMIAANIHEPYKNYDPETFTYSEEFESVEVPERDFEGPESSL